MLPVSRLEVDISPPATGWMLTVLRCDDTQVSISSSYTPVDSFEALVSAASFLMDGCAGERRVTFYEGPRETDVAFAVADDGSARVRATRHAGAARTIGAPGVLLLDGEIRAADAAAVVALAARSIEQGTGRTRFEMEWRHPFPSRILADLEARLRAAPASNAQPRASHRRRR